MVTLDDLLDALADFFFPEPEPFGFPGPFPQGTRVVEGDEPAVIPLREDPVFGPVVRAIEAETGAEIDALSYDQVTATLDEPAVRTAVEGLPESAKQTLAARDPETGQFVSDDSAALTANVVNEVHPNAFAFDDFIQQDIHVSAKLDPSATTGSDLSLDGNLLSGLYIEDPPLTGVIDRDHVAELLVVDRQTCVAHIEPEGGADLAGTAPSSFVGELELLLQPRPTSELDVAGGEIEQNLGNIGEGSADDFSEAVAYTYVESDTLDFITLATNGGMINSADGYGGGWVPANGPTRTFNYRANLGRGPIVQDDQVMAITNSMEWNELPNYTMHMEAQWTLYWDVYEFEKRRLADIEGRT